MPEVLFAGYKVPHPLQPYFLIKIQTDGSIAPAAVLEQACTNLIGTLANLEASFKREFSYKEAEPTDGQDAYGGSGPDGMGGTAWSSTENYLDL